MVQTAAPPPPTTNHQPPCRPHDHGSQPPPESRAPPTSTAAPTTRVAAPASVTIPPPSPRSTNFVDRQRGKRHLLPPQNEPLGKTGAHTTGSGQGKVTGGQQPPRHGTYIPGTKAVVASNLAPLDHGNDKAKRPVHPSPKHPFHLRPATRASCIEPSFPTSRHATAHQS